MPSNKVCRCGRRSVPGLIQGVALCQYHYNERMFGTAWALAGDWNDAILEDDRRLRMEQDRLNHKPAEP